MATRRAGLTSRLNAKHVAMAALASIFVVVPFVTSDEYLEVLIYSGIFAVGAIGLNLLTGTAGQVSIGHSFFVAIGAYCCALMGSKLGLPMPVYVVVAVVVSGAAGALIGPIALRLRGHYLAVVTFGVVMVADYGWRSWTPLTGGSSGISTSAAAMTLGPIDLQEFGGFTREQTLFWTTWLIVAAVVTYVHWITRTRPGRGLRGVHDNEVAAETLGVDVMRAKVKVFVAASAIGGLCGALYAPYQQYINPQEFGLSMSIMFVQMIVIGGLGSVFGGVLGALVVWGGQQMLARSAESSPLLDPLLEGGRDSGLLTIGEFNALVFNALVVILLVFEPKGIAGIATKLSRRLERGTKKCS